MPRLIKLKQEESQIIQNLPENLSFYEPQCKQNYDEKVTNTAEMSTFEYSQIEDIDESLYHDEQEKKQIDQIVKIDANKYAEITWKQNEMILNGKKYMEKQRNAQKMKVNALRHEIEKLEKRTDKAASDIQIYQNQFEHIQQNHKELEENHQKQNFLAKINALEDQINNAVDQSETMQVSYTPSEINILIEMGYAKNDSLLNKCAELEQPRTKIDKNKKRKPPAK